MPYLIRLTPYNILRIWTSDLIGFGRWLALHSWWQVPAVHMSVRGLRRSQRGRKAYVFANGPSLRTIDLSMVADAVKSGARDLFAVNSYVSSPASRIAPATHYVLSDPAHFQSEPCREASDAIHDPPKNVAHLAASQVREIYIPFQFRREGRRFFGNRVRLFCDHEFRLWRNTTDIRWPRSFCTMTAFKALQIACFLGYDEIMIAGFDNDYFKRITVDKNNVLWEVDEHFYDHDGGRKRRVCHHQHNSETMSEYLIANAMLFSDLEQFRFAHRQIVNLVDDSLVDAFPKRSAATNQMSGLLGDASPRDSDSLT